MKKTLYIFTILLLSSCKNPIIKENIVLQKTEKDTIFRISNPFKINNMEIYWKYYFTTEGEMLMTLKEHKTNITLLEHSDIIRLEFDYHKNYDYLNEQYLENFQDVNFDDYVDFALYSNQDSGSGGAFFRIYLFNNDKKVFECSEELSGGEVETDTINKTLTTFWKSGTSFNFQKTFHFGQNGKIEFTENFVNEYLEENIWKTEYRKIINGKVVEQKIDTIKE